MAIVKLFKNKKQFINVVLPSGDVARFVHGKAFTENKKMAAELQTYADNNEAEIYVDPAEPTIDTECLNPLEQIRRQAVADYIARQAPKVNPGNSVQSPMVPMSTSDSGVLGGADKVAEEAEEQMNKVVTTGIKPMDLKARLAEATATKGA